MLTPLFSVETQAKSHKLSGKIQRTKARKAKKAAKTKKPRRLDSPGLSDNPDDNADGAANSGGKGTLLYTTFGYW
jgi:hypothetical protein